MYITAQKLGLGLRLPMKCLHFSIIFYLINIFIDMLFYQNNILMTRLIYAKT